MALDKEILRTAKPGDKFTVEFEILGMNPDSIRTTSANCLSLNRDWGLIAFTPKPEPIKVGDVVAIYRGNATVLVDCPEIDRYVLRSTRAKSEMFLSAQSRIWYKKVSP